ncbi:hypothetical protein E2C05_31475, partial [Paracraurococcus ruber]|uniref:hypothetical protein n=1 Tax=Paracraurococcus ruber TaxID=77675 RepID=UPI001961B5EE
MPVSRAGKMLLALMLALSPAVPALAQGTSQGAGTEAARPGGAAARPGSGPAGLGLAPLQTEPGDIWADVRSWTEKRGQPEPRRRREPTET